MCVATKITIAQKIIQKKGKEVHRRAIQSSRLTCYKDFIHSTLMSHKGHNSPIYHFSISVFESLNDWKSGSWCQGMILHLGQLSAIQISSFGSNPMANPLKPKHSKIS
jgi:hypothetical protein